MTPRVWRQLAAEADVSPARRDDVIRMALAAMAADPTSGLTVAQRQWVIDLATRTEPLTFQERGRLKTPLLAYIKERMPSCEAIITKQFDGNGP